jgi:hypothetical protein
MTMLCQQECCDSAGRRAAAYVVDSAYAEDSADPDCHRAGDGGATAPASRRFLHSLECAQPGWLQTALLREQELLRDLEEKHATGLATSRQNR